MVTPFLVCTVPFTSPFRFRRLRCSATALVGRPLKLIEPLDAGPVFRALAAALLISLPGVIPFVGIGLSSL
ncbi:hypothetical protein KJ839_02030 [Patescibacteria group bacterium]|nr:hypothetical protein [Patescibacteria group bacterium]MBU1963021.1 hypothetical protein [Patescibacteria group bacterium]